MIEDADVKIELSREASVYDSQGRQRNVFQEGTAAVRIVVVLPTGAALHASDSELRSLAFQAIRQKVLR